MEAEPLMGAGILFAAGCLALASGGFPMIAIVGFAGLAVAVAAWARSSPLSFVSPVVLLNLSALAYSVFLPLSKLAGWRVYTMRAGLIESEAFDTALLLSLASAVALTAGAYVARARAITRDPIRLGAAPDAVGALAWILLFVGGAATLGLITYGGGAARLASLSYSARYLAVEPVAFLKYGPVLLGFAVTVFYFALQSQRRIWTVIGMGIASSLLALDVTVMERRTPVYIAVIGVLVIRTVFGAGKRNWSLVAAAAVLLLSIPVTSFLRGGGELHQFTLERANPASYEFGSSFLTLVDMVERVPDASDLQLGSTYVAAFGILVPSILWPNRPASLPERYVNSYYRGLARAGGGLAFSPVAEAYMNFGALGIPAVFFVIGVVAARSESFLRERLASDPTWILGYALFTPWLLLFYRLDFGSFLKLGVVYTLLVFLALRSGARVLAFRSRREAPLPDSPAQPIR